MISMKAAGEYGHVVQPAQPSTVSCVPWWGGIGSHFIQTASLYNPLKSLPLDHSSGVPCAVQRVGLQSLQSSLKQGTCQAQSDSQVLSMQCDVDAIINRGIAYYVLVYGIESAIYPGPPDSDQIEGHFHAKAEKSVTLKHSTSNRSQSAFQQQYMAVAQCTSPSKCHMHRTQFCNKLKVCFNH
eukprot:Gb_32706 [translate_table: standard]